MLNIEKSKIVTLKNNYSRKKLNGFPDPVHKSFGFKFS